MDICVHYNQEPDQWELECYNCQKKSISFVIKFHLILICLCVPKVKKIVTKYVVQYGNELYSTNNYQIYARYQDTLINAYTVKHYSETLFLWYNKDL